MGSTETRFLREISQLKRTLVKTKEREQQTREGCLHLVQALGEIAAQTENDAGATAEKVRGLVQQASVLLAPDTIEY